MSKPSEIKNRAVETRLAASPSIFLTLTVFAAAVAFAGESSPNQQLPAGAMQEKVAAACSTCHEARITVQQRLTKPAWTKEVDKMIKWGAEVDPKDRDAMIDYFSTNFSPDQPAYVAPRSGTQSTARTKAKNKDLHRPRAHPVPRPKI